MWGERAVGGFFEDIHVLIVVVLGMSILLGSFAAAFATYGSARERAALQAEAAEILRTVLEGGPLLHDGESRLLDLIALEALNGTGLSGMAGTDLRVQLVVAERTGDVPRTFLVETAPSGPERASASTAAAVWHSDLDVRAARVTVTLGR